MMDWKFEFLFLLVGITGVWSALPACAPGVTKPTSGIWSEWVITGPQKCSTSCGSCSKLFHTRTCLTTRIGISCNGDFTRLYPCNTQTCIYPAQRTCCIPNVPMSINGSMQCGPFPKDPTPTSTPCCPVGGLWTEWTKYARNASSSYIRTRECVAKDAGCPCTEPDIDWRSDCPCPTALRRADSCDSEWQKATMFRPMDINDADCTALLRVDASNDYAPTPYCNKNEGLDFVPYLRFLVAGKPSDGVNCPYDRPFNCETRDKSLNYSKMPVSFTCDLETLSWRYDYYGWLITGYVQMSFRLV